MRIACPLSSGIGLTSAMTEPPLLRIGSTSIGFVASNSSHTVSARRNIAAGVMAENANVRCRPSLSRRAVTTAALPLNLASGAALLASGGVLFASGGALDAAAAIFGGTMAAGAGVSLAGGSGICASATGAGASFGVSFVSFGASVDASLGACAGICGSDMGDVFGVSSGLTSMLACRAIVSDVGCTISLVCRDAGADAAGFSAAGMVVIGAAGAGACDASDTGDVGTDAFSCCWNATSIM